MTAAGKATMVPIGTLAMLMLAVFAVSIGYGIVLPVLPALIERLLGSAGDTAQMARATGLLTALYTVSMFLFAPLWGHLSDRYGRRPVLLIGLIGFSATMLAFAFIENMIAIYAERFLSGLFAAAVTPVALPAVGDMPASEPVHARHLTFISLAGISGFLLGPMMGVLLSKSGNVLPFPGSAGTLALPLAATATLALLAAAGVAKFLSVLSSNPALSEEMRALPPAEWPVPKLLALAFIVSAGVGTFEVGLALRGKQELGLTPYQIAVMFTECSLVMIVVQAVVFSPWMKPEATRWLIAPALAILAIALFLVPQASDFALMLVVIGAVAASAGILSPILTYWISATAGKARGAQLGVQTAAASLGAAFGSAAGGMLFDFSALPGAAFMLVAALTALALLLTLGLPKLLLTRAPVEASAVPSTAAGRVIA